ncbi:MAG TPA: squalene/phytoene synthase family protein [Acidimicrobiales bacterium]|nr:squalene/phytoene synthase family protein [Acidimicrobiales bacterium]
MPSEAAILGRAAGENFTVASRLLPATPRRHLLAFYGWARLVDQLGDHYDGDRLAALDWAEAELRAGLTDPSEPGLHPLVAAAAASGRELGLDAVPFVELIEANRMDQRVTRYATWDDLVGYCRLSANPVGHLVLAAFGADTGDNRRLADRICTGLQVVEHLQDVGEDAAAGRVYLPVEDLVRFDVDPDGLAALAASGSPAPAGLRGVVAFETWRARGLLDDGAALVGRLKGTARVAVAGFAAGGLAVVDALAAAGYDPLTGPTRPAPPRVAAHLARLLLPRSGRPAKVSPASPAAPDPTTGAAA